MTGTLTAAGDPARRRTRAPRLTLILECARPLTGPARWSLVGVNEARLGRGETRRVARRDGDAGRTLFATVPDPRMSNEHARLSVIGGRWVLEDAGSKNGTRVNGALERRVVLKDGDLLEVGETLLLYGEDDAEGPEDSADLEGASLQPPAPGLGTLVPALAREVQRLAQVARSNVPIVLSGETGTGKEVVARAIHALAGRPGPFVAVNCGALPDTLVESELFGARKGAFSGATEDRPGLIRSAHQGTLLLDEVADLPLESQAALLRVLQEREVVAVGATRPVPIDVRIVSATHGNLETLVSESQFRADLFARLAGFTFTLPPLRERREDMGLILAALLARLEPARSPRVTLSIDAARALLRHSWPLNVRELEQCLAAALALATHDRIELEHLPAAVRAPAPSAAPQTEEAPSLSAAEEEERERLVALVRKHAGNLSAVAREMDKERKQIQRWVRRYGIDPDRYRP